MTTKISKLFPAPSAYEEATTTNYSGTPAFGRSAEERLIQVLTTGTFENTFYTSAKNLVKEAVEIFREFAKNDPKFLAQAIVYARTKGLMRLAPITALVILSTGEKEAKIYFRQIFKDVIKTPGDLADFLSLVRTSRLRGMGATVQHAAQNWLANISEYHVIKYGSEHQTMSLRDMYRIARPKLTGKANDLANYIVKGKEVSADLWQINAYENFKQLARELKSNESETSLQEVMALVERARLPWEVVTAHVPSNKDTWSVMMRQMPYMAMLRNLRNLVNYGVLADEESLQYVVQFLTDPGRVKNSKQFPFRFLAAANALRQQQPWNVANKEMRIYAELLNALNRALEISIENIPYLGGKVGIFNDVSGSMSAKVSDKSDISCSDVAAVLSASVYKRSRDAMIVSFNTSVLPRNIDAEGSLLDLAGYIASGGGGTDLGAPILHVLKSDITLDTMVFLTDSEDWYGYITRGRGVLDEIRRYRKRNPKANFFFVQLTPYGQLTAPQSEPGVHYLYGWSDDVLRYISTIASGEGNQVEYVRSLVLGSNIESSNENLTELVA